MSRDPAMLVYLDNATNRQGQPNENFAREVMELFTLGEGHYGEQDIKEAARAFTGWSIDLETGEFLFRPRQHDDGDEDCARTQRASTAEPTCSTCCSRSRRRRSSSPPSCGASSSRRSREPRRGQARGRCVARAAATTCAAAMRALAHSDAFWAPENRGALIKSPIDLVVGTLRQFGIAVNDPLPFAFLSA